MNNSFRARVKGALASNEPLEIDRDSATLEEWKAYKYACVDVRSADLIKSGFVYNGKTFSLSETAQLNILGVERKKNVTGLLPVTFNTIDDSDTHALTTVGEVDDFFMAALVAKKGYLDSGTALKSSIRAATTKGEVDAVVDNR